jgi:hypothetical protein
MRKGVSVGRPGLFHSVPLRPYYDYVPVMIDLHIPYVMVGAQCNTVQLRITHQYGVSKRGKTR